MADRGKQLITRVHLPQTIWLTVVWVILWGNLSVANVLGGFFVSLVVLALFPLPPLGVPLRFRPIAVIILVVRFFWDMTKASTEIAWLALRPQTPPGSMVVDMKLMSRNALFQTITAEMVALVPGSLVIDLDSETGRLTLHVFNVGSREEAEEFRSRVLAQEARLLRAFHVDPDGVLNPAQCSASGPRGDTMDLDAGEDAIGGGSE